MNLLCKALATILFLATASSSYAGSTHPGGVNGDIQVNQNGNFGPLAIGSGLTLTPGSPPSLSSVGGSLLTSGAAAPTGSCTSGNGYTDTSDGPTFYSCVSSAWQRTGYTSWTINSTPGFDPQNSYYMALTSSNTVATVTGGGVYNYGGLAVTPAKAGGKRYFELKVSSTSFLEAGIGTISPVNYQGGQWGQSGDPRQLAWLPGGTVYLPNGNSVGTANAWGAGDWTEWAVDFTNHEIWLRVNGGNWNNNGSADPDTNVGGFSWAPIGPGPVFIGLNLGGGIGASATINLGTSSFAHTPPSTFTSWIH